MTDKQNNPDPIAHAARLLREAAEELRQAHAFPRSEGWQGETGAQSAYDVYMAAAQALEDWEAAAGAGGVQALSAAPEAFLKSVIALCSHRGYSPANIEAWDKNDKWIADLWRQAEAMLAASPTPPAEQQAITPETGNSVSAQGAAITSESGAVYAELPDFDSGDEPIWEAIFKWANATPGSDAHKKADAVSGAIINALRDFADRTHAKRASHGQAPAPLQRLHDLLYAAQRQTSRDAMHGAITAARIELSKLMAAPKAQPAPAATPQTASQPAPEVTALVENGHVTQAGHDLLMAATRASATLIHPGRVVTDAESPTPPAEQQAAPKAAPVVPRLTRQDDALCGYLADCDDNAITPDVAGAFAWAWAHASVAAPQPAPAPLSDDAKDAARWRWLSEHIGAAWNEGKFTSLVRIVSDKNRAALNASIDRMMTGDWSDAALAAHGGK